MTDTRQRPVSFAIVRRPFRVVAIPAGFVAGALLGVVARLWMRWISTDPEFSWSGTTFIVLAFAVFGAAQAGAWAARHAGWRRSATCLVRFVAAVLSLGLFTAAGAMMLPTVVAASLARWRRDWPRPWRIGVAVISVPIAAVVVWDIARHGGWTVWTFGRVALFLAIYGVIVTATQPTVAPQRDGAHARRQWRPEPERD
jgi:hypothetical protein